MHFSFSMNERKKERKKEERFWLSMALGRRGRFCCTRFVQCCLFAAGEAGLMRRVSDDDGGMVQEEGRKGSVCG